MVETVTFGNYEVSELLLTAHNGFELDLKDSFAALAVFEDIFSPSVTATVAMVDPEGILNFAPIIGQETVKLKFITVGLTEPIEKEFVVNKITALKSDVGQQKYNLELITKDLISNYENRISEHFEGSATDIAQICFDRLGSDVNLDIEPSSDKYNSEIGIIIPNMTPMKACSFMTERAFHDEYKSSSYLFFESSKGYVMKPVEMLTQAEPKNKFQLGRYKNTGENSQELEIADPNFENKKVVDYSFISNFTVLDNVAKGLYKSKLTTIDLITRTKKEHRHSFWENSMEYKYLNQEGGAYENETPDSPIFDISGQGVQYDTEQEYLLPEVELNSGRPMFNQEKIFLQRMFFMQLMNNIKCSVTVYGDSDLSVGDTIELSLPIFSRLDLGNDWEDKYYSGKYLICAIRHRIDNGRYYNDMELIKDSMNDTLPAPVPVVEGKIQ